MCEKDKKSNKMPEQESQQGNQIMPEKYPANKCIAGLVAMMLAVFIVFMFGFPFILKLVYGGLANSWLWNKVPPVVSEGQEDKALSVLPDFLGGLCGIIIGFLFDFWFIDRIRKISRYKFLASSVNREFAQLLNSIDSDCNGELKAFIKSTKNAAKENNDLPDGIILDGNEIKYLENFDATQKKLISEFCKKRTIKRWDLDDIVTNVENDALFYKLPFMGSKLKGKMTDCLHIINGCILRFDDSTNENEMAKELIFILVNIHKFFIYTGYEYIEKE